MSHCIRTAVNLVILFILLSTAAPALAAPESPADAASGRVSMIPLVLTPAATTSFAPVTQPDPVVQEMIPGVGMDTIEQYMGDLSGEWPVMIRGAAYTILTRNTQSGTPIQQATTYVGDHLTALGMNVEYHRWGPESAPNVIGQITGETRPGEVYMLTAHLDDMPDIGTAPGADDNASGSVGVLVAADILSQYHWNCTLRFAFWTGEEQGLLGSDKYASRAKSQGENILGVLNLDMIAWNTAGTTPEMDLHAKASMPATVDLANQFASVVDVYGINLVPEVRPDGTGASDHASFWKYGFNAILGIEDYYPGNHDFNPYYHTTDDRLSRLDMAYYTEFIKASVAEMAHMTDCVVKTPTAPAVAATLEPAPLTLTWPHVVPNTAYQVHRSAAPYFAPAAETLLAVLDRPFPDLLAYPDDSGAAGNVAVNYFYIVSGMNEAGASAASNRTGEFDFTLVRGG